METDVTPETRVTTAPTIEGRLAAWHEFTANAVRGVVVDDSREAIYADEVGRVQAFLAWVNMPRPDVPVLLDDSREAIYADHD